MIWEIVWGISVGNYLFGINIENYFVQLVCNWYAVGMPASQARVGDDDDGRISPEHPSLILHAPRDIISCEGKSLTPIRNIYPPIIREYIRNSIRFASPGGPEKMLWNTAMLAEHRRWHAQMCLRLCPQGHENSVAFDVHCIVLEVFVIVLAPFWCCFVASKAPGRMKRLF